MAQITVKVISDADFRNGKFGKEGLAYVEVPRKDEVTLLFDGKRYTFSLRELKRAAKEDTERIVGALNSVQN